MGFKGLVVQHHVFEQIRVEAGAGFFSDSPAGKVALRDNDFDAFQAKFLKREAARQRLWAWMVKSLHGPMARFTISSTR